MDREMKVIVVGGVAGGASTVARLRRRNESLEIVLFEKGKEISYANCGIPYYIGDVIKERSKLNIITREEFARLFKTDVRTGSEVVSINRKKKTVTVKDLNNNNLYEENYDKLVLSPGGSPIRPAIPGINDSRIFTLRNLEDMDLIKNYITEKQPTRGIIVGAGFIGLEVAENLKALGIGISIVELANQVMNLVDYEMAAIVHQHLHTKQVELYLKDGVQEFKGNTDNITAVLQSGRKIDADLVILAIGVRPEVKLAKEAGITLGDLGGIRVNDRMLTSDPDIYALGDATEITDCISGKQVLVPLANSANKQGRIVADNILGGERRYRGTPGTAIAKIFDLVVASTGMSEKRLKKEGMDYGKVYHHPGSHAGYYPDAFPMAFKLIYAPGSGQILGAQIIGSDGVDKRIDVLSAMIQKRMTVQDLADMELAYAPPFNSAKDAINLAGMIAINQMEGANPVVNWDQVETLQKEGTLFLDVRTPLEYKLGHIEGSVNIPLEEIRERITEIPRDKKIVLYCNQGKNAYFALSFLKNLGYSDLWNLNGGYKLYRFTNQPQELTGIFDDMLIDKKDDLHYALPSSGELIKLDACGLQCPGPIMKLSQTLPQCKDGDVLEITSTDPGFRNDIGIWCKSTGHTLLALEDREKKTVARIQKGSVSGKTIPTSGSLPNDKTIVVFSSDLDRALASFIIAGGAASMGRKVTMFFTFWGLNILRKSKKVKVKKRIIDRMFGLMMPRGARNLKLSKLNMLGMGTGLMKSVMKKKKISSLNEMIRAVRQAGVNLVACQMTMDMMGIRREELLEGVKVGGVASYLGAAESADTNLFI